MKNCKECIHSKIITQKKRDHLPEEVCTLSDKDFHDCLFNDRSKFEGNQLYFMCKEKGDAE